MTPSLPPIVLRQLASRSEDENLRHFTEVFPKDTVTRYDAEVLAGFPSIHRLARVLLPTRLFDRYLGQENAADDKLRDENEKIRTDYEVQVHGLSCWVGAELAEAGADARRREVFEATMLRRERIRASHSSMSREAEKSARLAKAQALLDLLAATDLTP